jgi:hypothetical protein
MAMGAAVAAPLVHHGAETITDRRLRCGCQWGEWTQGYWYRLTRQVLVAGHTVNSSERARVLIAVCSAYTCVAAAHHSAPGTVPHTDLAFW